MIINGRERGFTLIEVLISILVFSIGLLGFATLQKRAQIAEFEAYQRIHALNYINFIVNQMKANPEALGCYAVIDWVGEGTDDPAYDCSPFATTETRTQAEEDLTLWNNLLSGTGESLSGANVGGLQGARGCIDFDGTDTYTVTIAWEGMNDTASNASTCASAKYSSATRRRILSYRVTFGDL